MISAPESMHTEISFVFSVTEPISAAEQPAHGDCESSLTAPRSMLSVDVSKELSSSSLSSASCLSRVVMSLLGYQVTLWIC